MKRLLKGGARKVRQTAKAAREASQKRLGVGQGSKSGPDVHAERPPSRLAGLTEKSRRVTVYWKGKRTSAKFSTVADRLRSSKALGESVAESLLVRMKPAFESSTSAAKRSKNHAAILLNAILASDFSHSMETWLGNLANKGAPSIYDQAMDAVYNTTNIGGGQLHRLYDGSHTLWGAWDKVHGASSDDTPLQEILGYASGLGKDLSTHVGLPLFGMSKPTYEQVAGVLSETFHIPRSWFQDLLHVNGVELIGASIGTVAVAFNWNKKDVEEFSRLAGSLGLSSVASANPALALVALVTVAKSFNDARHKGDYSEFVDGLAKGGVGTGVFIATATFVPGAVLVGLLAGVCAGVAANKAMNNVSVSQISRYVESSLRREIKRVQESPALDSSPRPSTSSPR